MILITGSTGHLGKAVLNSLLKKVPPHQIAALARDFQKAEDVIATGVEVIKGDYNNYPSMVRAFVGMEKLLLISSNDIDNRTTQHINAINAAKEAGVKHVYYTSFQRKYDGLAYIDFIDKSHVDTEKHLSASGLNYTILKNSLYMDVIPLYIGKDVWKSGKIFFPAGDGRVSFAVRTDIAEATASLLLGNGHENKVYEIAGDKTYSFDDVADILSELSGTRVEYISPTVDIYKKQLAKAGVPLMYIDMLAGFGQAIAEGAFDNADPTLKNLLGRKPIELEEFLKGTYADQFILKTAHV